MTLTTQQQMTLRQQRTLAMTPELRQAIGLLKYTNAELNALLSVIAKTNPAIQLLPESPSAPLARPQAPRGISAGGTDLAEATLAQGEGGLHEHVRRQIGLTFRDPSERAIAETFLEALEPSGWLRLPIPEIARESGCTTARAESVLARLHQFEPAGLFARTLAECLFLQAADRGILTPTLQTVLDHLDLLARGAFDALSRLCNATESDIRAILEQLRTLDPKPGAKYGSDPMPVRPPDLIVHPHGVGSWRVELNHSTSSRIIVREPCPDALPDVLARETALNEAKWLERAVSRRNATTLRIASEVVRQQGAFLRQGRSGLKPLSFSDIAAGTDLHESTVSRVVAGLMVQTPRGAVNLRDFFSVALTGGTAGPVAAGALREAIACMIADEDPVAPLSDDTIARRLNATGASLARRTVAKYREMLRIPGSSERRARARLAPGC